MADRFQHLFDSLAEKVVVIDRDLVISYANPAWLRQVGRQPSQVIGHKCHHALLGTETPCKDQICDIQQILETGQPAQLTCQGYHADSVDPSRVSASPVLDPDGQVTAVIQVTYPSAVESVQEEASLVQSDNTRLLEAARAKADQMQLLGDLGQRVLSILDPQDLLDYAVQAIQQRFGYYHVDIFLVDPDQEYVVFQASSNREIAPQWQAQELRFRIGQEGIVGLAAASGEPYLANDVSQDANYISDDLLPKTRSELAVPIRAGDRIIGVLDLNSDRLENFDDDDLFVAQSLADQLASGLENARLYAAANRRVAELEAIRRASLSLTSSLELQEVLETILEMAISLVHGAKDAHIFLYQEGQLSFGAALWADGRRGEPWAEPRPEGLTYTVARQVEPIVVSDMRSHPLFHDAPAEWEGAIIGLPLKFGQQVVGVMSLAYEQPRTLPQTEIRILHLLADQAAVAIENARLYQQSEGYATELVQRAERLAVVNRISTAVNSTLDLQEILDTAAREVAKAFAVKQASIILVNEQTQRAYIAAEYQATPDNSAAGVNIWFADDPLFEKLVDTKQPLAIENAAEDPLMVSLRDIVEVRKIRSLLLVPLLVRNTIIGVITLDAIDDTRHFRPEEIDLARTIANQVAIAIENAQLFADVDRRRSQAETLQAATQALSTTLDLQEIFEVILSELRKVVPYDSASVQQLEGNQLEIIGGHGFPNPDEVLGLKFDVTATDNPNRQVVRTRTPVLLGNAPSIYKEFSEKPHAQACTRSWLGVPLLFGDRLIGMLALDKQEYHFYSAEHARLAMAFAAQAAIAIENARLYQETEMRAKEMAALAAVGRAMTTLEPDAVLDNIARNALEAVNAEISSVYLLDKERKLLKARSVCGINNQELEAASFALGEGTIGQTAQTGEALIVHDTSSEHAFVAKSDAAQKIRNTLTVPLQVKQEIIGTLEVCNKVGGGQFTTTDRHLLMTFADQAALAIDNARLYQEKRHHLEEVQILNHVAQEATSTLDFDEVIRRGMKALLNVRNYERVNILLVDETKQDLWLHPALTDGEIFPQRANIRIRLGQGIAGWVAQTGQVYRSGDVRQEERYVVGYPDTLSELCVPLRLGERIIGVLDVQSTKLGAYSSGDERLLTTLAGQMSTLLENSRLFAETEQRVKELEALMQVSQALNRAEGLKPILRIVLDEAFTLVGSREGSIILIDPPRSNRLRIVAERGLGQAVVEAFNNRPVYTHEGTYKHALRTGKIVEIPDTRSSPDFLDDVGSQAQSVTNIPLVTDRGAIGLIALDGLPKDDNTRRLLLTLAGMAAVAIDKERLYQETAVRLGEVTTLYNLSTQITHSLSLTSVLEATVAILRLTLDCRSCCIFLVDSTGEHLQLEAGSGPASTWKGIARLRLGEGISGRVFTERRSVYVPDTQKEKDFIYFDPQIRSLLVVPLIVRNKAIGTLSIDDIQPNAFDGEVQMLTIAAAQAAVAIGHAQVYESLQNSYKDLEQAYDELRHLDKMKSELVQNISHELRTPLTFIKGYVELLQDGEMGQLQPEQNEALDIVATKAEVLSKLVDDIITLQQAGQERLQIEPLSLSQVGHKAIGAATVAAQEVELSIVDEIPDEEFLVLGDRRRLGQVFDNLLQNAIKFSKAGGTITVSMHEEESAVHAEVRDTGIGIPQEYQSRIFERFFQVDGTTTRRFGGTGLGLAIVKEIVESHGGQVNVESEEGQGSSFQFTIPKSSAKLGQDQIQANPPGE